MNRRREEKLRKLEEIEDYYELVKFLREEYGLKPYMEKGRLSYNDNSMEDTFSKIIPCYLRLFIKQYQKEKGTIPTVKFKWFLNSGYFGGFGDRYQEYGGIMWEIYQDISSIDWSANEGPKTSSRRVLGWENMLYYQYTYPSDFLSYSYPHGSSKNNTIQMDPIKKDIYGKRYKPDDLWKLYDELQKEKNQMIHKKSTLREALINMANDPLINQLPNMEWNITDENIDNFINPNNIDYQSYTVVYWL